jgi:hypothetical protein
MVEIRRIKREQREKRMEEKIRNEMNQHGNNLPQASSKAEPVPVVGGGGGGGGVADGGLALEHEAEFSNQEISKTSETFPTPSSDPPPTGISKQQIRTVQKAVDAEYKEAEWFQKLNDQQKNELYVYIAKETMFEILQQKAYDMQAYIEESVQRGIKTATKHGKMADYFENLDEEDLDDLSDFLAEKEMKKLERASEKSIQRSFSEISSSSSHFSNHKEEEEKNQEGEEEEEVNFNEEDEEATEMDAEPSRTRELELSGKKQGGKSIPPKVGGQPPTSSGKDRRENHEANAASQQQQRKVFGDANRSFAFRARQEAQAQKNIQKTSKDFRRGYEEDERYPNPHVQTPYGFSKNPPKKKPFNFSPNLPPVNEFFDPFDQCF